DFLVPFRLVHHLDVAFEEVVNRLDADFDRSTRLVLVDVLEREIRSARSLDDRLDGRVDRRIVAALETRELQSDQVGVARRELRRPHLLIRARGIAVLPDVLNIEWAR